MDKPSARTAIIRIVNLIAFEFLFIKCTVFIEKTHLRKFFFMQIGF